MLYFVETIADREWLELEAGLHEIPREVGLYRIPSLGEDLDEVVS